MKIHQFLVAICMLCIVALPAGQLQAQCGLGNAPNIEIGDDYISHGQFRYIPVTAHNFTGATFYALSFCKTGSPNLSIAGVINQLNGQSVSLDPSGKVTIFWGNPFINCNRPITGLPQSVVLAYIMVYASPNAGFWNTINIDLCDNAPNAPSHVTWCDGFTFRETEPAHCTGTVIQNQKKLLSPVKGDQNSSTPHLKMLQPSAESAANSTETVSTYPNPFQNEVSFSVTTELATQAEIRVYDLTGKLLYADSQFLSAGHGELTLDGGEWPSGPLMYEVITENNRVSGKLIHQK